METKVKIINIIVKLRVIYLIKRTKCPNSNSKVVRLRNKTKPNYILLTRNIPLNIIMAQKVENQEWKKKHYADSKRKLRYL